MNSVVLHCDNDNYFASIEEKDNPALKNIPFVVCGDPAMRHSIVMAKNTLAKRVGIRTGISYSQARQIYPGLHYVKANMSRYLTETQKTREVFLKYTENIIPYGMDESWIILDNDITMHEAKQIADIIRLEMKYTLGLSASVGVSFNYIFSKLGSDMNKPNGTTVITKDNYKELVWPLPASELLFVGPVRKKSLEGIGLFTIGDVAKAEPERLGKLLGKVGYDLWRFSNGDDRHFNPAIDEIGSVGNTLTPPEDLYNDDEVSAVIYMIVNAICTRLRKHNLKTRCVSICLRDNKFEKTIRQCTLSSFTDNVNTIFNSAFRLFKKNYKWQLPLRSIGVRVDGLTVHEQLSLFEYDYELAFDISNRVRALTERFGELNFEKTATTREW